MSKAGNFHGLMQGNNRFRSEAERLAPAIHLKWRENLKPEERGRVYDRSFEELTAEGKESNIAAALRIPEILDLAGFTLEEGQATKAEEAAVAEALEQQIEVLAEAEHNGWMKQKQQEGWMFAEVRDDSIRRHPLLRPFGELNNHEKEKDRRSIRSYPENAKAAGFKIVAK